MACPQIITGERFVTRILTHMDCQAQYLGSYGYQSLAEPGSLASVILTGLLTLFIALWGLRLLFGPQATMRDFVMDGLKVGVVLTLALSWPAFRTVVHDVVIHGPAEIAASLSTPGLAASGAGFVERLQGIDSAMVSLTDVGTGRRSGQFVDGGEAGASFQGSALEDESALGWSRLSFLAGLIGSLALLRIVAGLLLALTPVAAGLLLFDATKGLFAGWLRGLVLAVLAATGSAVVIGVELAILEPWLADALRLRQLGYATPSAPIELLAISVAFAIVQFAIIWLLGKTAFMPYVLVSSRSTGEAALASNRTIEERRSTQERHRSDSHRVERLVDHMKTRIQREERLRTGLVASVSGAQFNTTYGTSSVASQGSRSASVGDRGNKSASLSSGRRDAFR